MSSENKDLLLLYSQHKQKKENNLSNVIYLIQERSYSVMSSCKFGIKVLKISLIKGISVQH